MLQPPEAPASGSSPRDSTSMSHVHVIRTSPPETTEYAPYYGTYVGHVAPGDIVETLSMQSEATIALLRAIPEEKGGAR